jgi:hypothetical protein
MFYSVIIFKATLKRGFFMFAGRKNAHSQSKSSQQIIPLLFYF